MKPAKRQEMEDRNAQVKLEIAKTKLEADEAKRILDN
jgi:hypothetical protein